MLPGLWRMAFDEQPPPGNHDANDANRSASRTSVKNSARDGLRALTALYIANADKAVLGTNEHDPIGEYPGGSALTPLVLKMAVGAFDRCSRSVW